MLDWQKELSDPREFMETLRTDLFEEEVYVFTPKGEVKSLAAGATPLDFAYEVHTEIGHRCVGARVNGKIVPLHYELRSGDIVEILTAKRDRGPSRDWLAMVKTTRARNKIKQWFKAESRQDTEHSGRELLQEHLRKQGLPAQKITGSALLADVIREVGYRKADDFYIALGAAKISPKLVVNKVLQRLKQGESADAEGSGTDLLRVGRSRRRPTKSSGQYGIRVEGVDDVMLRLAKCCRPVPGDAIVGYISLGRGITIHREDCPNTALLRKSPERFADVHWEGDQSTSFVVEIQIDAWDRHRLLEDLSRAFSESGANILEARCLSVGPMVKNRFVVELADTHALKSAITRLRNIDSVFDAYRVTPARAPERAARRPARRGPGDAAGQETTVSAQRADRVARLVHLAEEVPVDLQRQRPAVGAGDGHLGDLAEGADLPVSGHPRAGRERAPGDRGHRQRRGPVQDPAAERARVQCGAVGDLDRTVLEVGERGAVLDDRRDALEGLAADLHAQARRAHEVAAHERRDGHPREVVGAEARLQMGVGVDALDDARVEAEARGEREAAAVDDAHVDRARLPVVGHRQQVLGRVDDVAGDAEHLREHVRRAARQAAQRGARGRPRSDQAVGRFVDGAVAAEGDDHVVALVGGLAAELGGVAAGLGVYGVDLVAALQRVHDEVAQAVGDRARVGVDDDQHAPPRLRRRQLEVVGRLGDAPLGLAGCSAHRYGLHRSCGRVTGAPGPVPRPAGAADASRSPTSARASSIAAPEMLIQCRLHSWTHPEGWRDWPYETPATTVTSQREGANSREMCGGLLALRHTGDTAKERKGPQWL